MAINRYDVTDVSSQKTNSVKTLSESTRPNIEPENTSNVAAKRFQL